MAASACAAPWLAGRICQPLSHTVNPSLASRCIFCLLALTALATSLLFRSKDACGAHEMARSAVCLLLDDKQSACGVHTVTCQSLQYVGHGGCA